MRTALLAVTVLAGCGDWFSEPPPPPLPEDAYLVWAQVPDGYQTQWRSAAGEVLSTHPGLTVAWDNQLWSLSSSVVSRPVLDCGCLMALDGAFDAEKPAASCVSEGTASRQVLTSGSRSIELVSGAPSDPWVSDQEQHLTPHGGAGPYLVFSVAESGYPCGAAHGYHHVGLEVIDLRAAGSVGLDALVSEASLRSSDPALFSAAREALRADGGSDTMIEPEAPLTLTAVWLQWGAAGLRADAQLTADACYACSDGGWSGYTRSHRFALPTLPAPLGAHAALPAALADAVPADPAQVWGFSRLRALPDELTALRGSLPSGD